MADNNAAVAALRARLWDAGFRPVPVITSDKRPIGKEWQTRARLDPPECLRFAPVGHALNTGILGDGLRGIDGDIDDPALAQQCRAVIRSRLGDAPVRYRANSPRFLALYRAAEGQPDKIVLAGTRGKIEVLGRGQQFVAFGSHPSGADLEWDPAPPGAAALAALPAVTEAAIVAVLNELAPLIGAAAIARPNGQDRSSGEPQADTLRIAAALHRIPNIGAADWEAWNRVGMAIWRATGGSAAGWEAWDAWSARNAAYDPAVTRVRWDHYSTSPPTSIGAGSLFHMAGLYHEPHEEPPPHPGPEPEPEPQRVGRIKDGDDFVANFTTPDWLIDGIVQTGRLYACTSLTGHGKTAVWLFNACMIHAGRMIGNLETTQGNVLILAGENPEDLKARMIGMMVAYKLKPNQLPYVLPQTFPMTDEEADILREEIARLGIPFALIVGDTAASFFPGEDENDNVQAGHYARTLRQFTEGKGNPAVVVLSHPVKNAGRDNLLPRGGGAFLNELDGNLTLWSDDKVVTGLHSQGKIRGPDFNRFGYRMREVDTGFVDRRGRPFMTVVAEPLSEEAVADQAKQNLANEDVVLRALRAQPGISWAQIAIDAGWVDDGGLPLKVWVQRAIRTLSDDKLIEQTRRGKPWRVTAKGERELDGDNQG